MDETEATELFVQNLARYQDRLMAYIFSLLGDANLAADVLQETNLALWRKHAEFHAGREFLPWAFGFARNQVLANLRDRRRDRQVLDPDLVEIVAEDVAAEVQRMDALSDALRICMSELSGEHQELVRQRYFHSKSVKELADSVERGLSDVKTTLFRIRRQLAKCIESRLGGESAAV